MSATLTDLARALLGLPGRKDGLTLPDDIVVEVEGCPRGGKGCHLMARQGGTGEVYCGICGLKNLEATHITVATQKEIG